MTTKTDNYREIEQRLRNVSRVTQHGLDHLDATDAADAIDALIKERDALLLALDEVADPIKYMRKRAKESGRQLNGGMAITISNDANFLKSIAARGLANAPTPNDKGK